MAANHKDFRLSILKNLPVENLWKTHAWRRSECPGAEEVSNRDGSDDKRGDIAPTCVAHYAKDLSTRLVADSRFPRGVRPYTVREYARLQGVPDTFGFEGSDNDAYRMIGNGVSVPVGKWIGSEIKRYFQSRIGK
jgi:DNA (cytosine-5)-methyltransferase 1